MANLAMGHDSQTDDEEDTMEAMDLSPGKPTKNSGQLSSTDTLGRILINQLLRLDGSQLRDMSKEEIVQHFTTLQKHAASLVEKSRETAAQSSSSAQSKHKGKSETQEFDFTSFLKRKPDGPESQQCPICDKMYYKFSSLQRHIKEIHQGREYKYDCPLCSKSFTQQYYLTCHLQEHEGIYKFVCELCGEGFVHKEKYRGHLGRVHQVHRRHLCSQCGKSLASKRVLERHMKYAHGQGRESSYPCSLCDKSFACMEYLNRHIKKRHEKKPEREMCPYCGKLYLHVKSHLLRAHPDLVGPAD